MSTETDTETQSDLSQLSSASEGQTKQVKTKKPRAKTATKTSKTMTASLSYNQVGTAVSQFEIHEIDQLTKQGAAAADIARLKETGIHTIEGLMMLTKKQISAVKGLSEAKVDKLIYFANQALSKDKIISADKVLEKRKNLIQISTGSAQFDLMMGGGIESYQICEVFGEFRCGKSQLCHTMAVTGQNPMIEGVKSNETYRVVYIDTESTFRPDRIQQIAYFHKKDPVYTLKNIFVSRCYNYEYQIQVLTLLPQLLVKDRFSLIIVDSITALFRVDFYGRGELAERQQTLGAHLSHLQKLAEEFNLLIFITNQVMADPSGAVFISNMPKPIGGHVLAHASTTRLSLRKGRGECRVAKIYDSPNLPEAECQFMISKDGIVDADE